jgi:N-acetylneuraminate synthase/N,N'-diacetyllegionaminate synthase
MAKTIQVGDKSIGAGAPVFVIAEAGVNHNGDLEMAKRLIDVAIKAGADAVKFQTFKAETLVTATAPKAEYQTQTTPVDESQLEMLRKLELSNEDHDELSAYCRRNGILFLSTPFDEDSADLLDALSVPVFKISSGDLTNTPLLEHVAKKRKPVILSTGMADLAEVRDAVETLNAAGCDEVVLLHCVSDYPADPADVNLRAIQTLRKTFNLPVGFSDHTQGLEVALAAAALGASVIEKHFTLDRNLPGPDHRASLEPDELTRFVSGIRTVESSLGSGEKVPTAREIETAKVARRSIVATQTIPAGTIVERNMIAAKRPGTGLPPARLNSIVGRKTRIEIPVGTLLTLDMFE